MGTLRLCSSHQKPTDVVTAMRSSVPHPDFSRCPRRRYPHWRRLNPWSHWSRCCAEPLRPPPTETSPFVLAPPPNLTCAITKMVGKAKASTKQNRCNVFCGDPSSLCAGKYGHAGATIRGRAQTIEGRICSCRKRSRTNRCLTCGGDGACAGGAVCAVFPHACVPSAPLRAQ